MNVKEYNKQLEMDFKSSFKAIAADIHDNAVDKGFWQASDNIAEKIALCHSELSEALESIRHGDPEDDKIPKFSGAEAELADCIIRIMDLSRHMKYRVAEAIIAKMKYNATRPKLHGKLF